MSQGTETAPVSRGKLTSRMISDVVAESAVAAGILFAIDALAHRKLTVGGFGLLLAGWVISLIVARLVRGSAAGAKQWRAHAIEVVGPLLWLAACQHLLKQPWTLPQMVYAAGLVYLLWQLWRRVAGGPGEPWRLLFVGLVAAGSILPFFTDCQLGGGDATWYTGVFIDFIQQLRAGVFPVFIGQGELSYNGSVNLFRSAPLCLWIGGVGDVLTWQSLSPVAIRNLAVIVAAFGAGFGMYVALVRLRPATADEAGDGWARWLAALGSALYLLCPAVLLSLHFYELQMTYTALLALPWIAYGNVRTMRAAPDGGYVALAVGLTLAWLAHVPLAVIATCCTMALQFGWFIFEPGAMAAQGKAAVRGGVIFALLSAYYFLGMSELAPVTGPSLPQEAGFILSFTLVVFSAVQVVWFRRWIWVAGWLAGAGLVAWLSPVWLVWVVIWSALWAVAAAVLHRTGGKPAAGWAVLLAVVTMLGAAALAEPYAAAHAFTPEASFLRTLADVAGARHDFIRPLNVQLGKYGNSQPGYALWALMIAAVVGAGWFRSVTLALLSGVMGLIVALVLPLPGVSDFVVGYAPGQMGNIINLPMLYRLVPPLAALAVVAGYLALLQWGKGRRAVQAGALAALVIGVAWSAWEARRVVGLSSTRIASRARTAEVFSPDRFVLGRYPYLMLYTPLHYMDGKQMPWMDSRLLTPHFDLIVGPDQLAQQAEKLAVQVHPLTSKEDESYPEWLRLTPGWEVEPGVTLLLRFEFDQGVNNSGWLIMSSDHGYQEHYLDPGFGGAGFGSGPMASHTIAVTNSGQHTERYTMRMKVASGNAMPRDGGSWGRLHISRYEAERAPVKLESLVPYRARVTISEDGYLETPRQWLPGYRAWIDGVRSEPVRVKSGMLGLPLKAGSHTVVLQFVGSTRLWTGLVISAATLLYLLVRPLTTRPGWVASRKQGFSRWIEANRT